MPLEMMCVGLMLIAAAQPARALPNTSGPAVEIEIPAPEPRRFVLALDEIELDWTEAARGERNERPAPASVPGMKVLEHERRRTRVRLERAGSVEALEKALAAALAANPGARGEIVVYEAGRPRTAENRQFLTSDVALLLNDGVLLEDVLPRANVRTEKVAAVPGGYVIRCETPFAGLNVARKLRSVEGVKRAYPLLKRTRVTR